MSNKTIKVESAIGRASLLIIALLFSVGAIFAFVWMFADSISDNAQDKTVAKFAMDLAPHNPQAHYSLAVLQEDSFIPEDIPKSLAAYEKAVALSPNDYRLWLALGKARERNGNTKGAELAIQRALKLAPNYSQVQWAYGNVLLRQGKNEKAFIYIEKAVAEDPRLAASAVATAWQIFDGDLDKIKKIVGDSNYAKAAFALFFTKEKRFDDAMDFWNEIPLGDKKITFEKEGEQLFNDLVKNKKYGLALDIENQISVRGFEELEVGKLNNGSFEKDIKEEKAKVFEWTIGRGTQPRVGIDNQQKRNGNRSLVFVFGGGNNKDFKGISQVVAVKGGQDYNFKLYYKTDLETSAKFVWEIVNTEDNKVIAKTESLAEKADWTSLNINFTTPEETEGILIRLVRAECSSTICPTSGKMWFDDLSLG